MIRLIVSIILLVVLAVFVALNMAYTTTINLYGLKLENVSVVAAILFAIVAGVIYSFGLYVASYFGKIRKTKLKQKMTTSKQKDRQLKEREKELATQELIEVETEITGAQAEGGAEQGDDIKPARKNRKRREK